MRKVISVLMSLVFIMSCVPMTTFATEIKDADAVTGNNKSKVYTANTGDVFFAEGYAKVGKPLNVMLKSGGTDFYCKWYVDGEQISNPGQSYIPVESDLESMVTAEAYGADGNLIGTVNMLVSKLPVMYIEIDGREELVQKETRLRASMKLQGNDEFSDSSVLYDGEMEIKGRGNSTWLTNKKPYKIKLDSKSDLLGMGKNKHWVLLSNPYDKSLSRNKLIYDLAADMGLAAMSSQWIDVVMNGKVVGNYLLCEHIRIGETRVNITNWDDIAEDAAKAIYKANKKTMSKDERDELIDIMTDNMDWVADGTITYKGKMYTVADYYDVPNANGGYILETVSYDGKYFTSQKGTAVSVSKPEGIGKEMLSGIKNYYSAYENAIYSEDFCSQYDGQKVRYNDLADIESLAKEVLLNEIFQNQDFTSYSTYMYKDVDGKLVAGPVWDLDMSSDNSSYSYSHNKWVIFGRKYVKYLAKDPVFLNEVYKAYRQYRYTAIADMLKPGGDFDTAFKKIYESGTNDMMLWNSGSDFEKEIENFRLWLSRRLDWIDSKMTSFETFYASVNGAQINNSGASTLSLDGSELKILSDSTDVEEFEVYINGIKVNEFPFSEEKTVSIGTVEENSVVSVASYGADGKYIGTSYVTNYSEPSYLKITAKPEKLIYSAGEDIDLGGLELKAVYSDGTEVSVEPEAAISYVSDCLGSQNPVYGKITDEIGYTYVSLRYLGARADYMITRTQNEDADRVSAMIAALPEENIADNLDLIFEAKQAYDALSDAAKKEVADYSKLDKAMKKVDELAENSESPIIGCYIDKLGRINQRNKIVVVATGTPNKIRVFCDGSSATFTASNLTSCIGNKQIGNYSLITLPYIVHGEKITLGAFYKNTQKGELYSFDTKLAVENRSQMVTSLSYPKTLASTQKTAEVKLGLNERVEKVKVTADGKTVTAEAKKNTAAVMMKFSTAGVKNLEISYYADREWHSYKSVSVYVRETKAAAKLWAVDYPSETAEDEVQIYVATSLAVGSVKLISDGDTMLNAVVKDNVKIWQCTVKTDTAKEYRLYVDSQDTGRTVAIAKLDKLLIEDGTLVKCRVKGGEVYIPAAVNAVNSDAFSGFNGTLYCYKDSAAQNFAEQNGIKYVNYGCEINIDDELVMTGGEKRTVELLAAQILPPDFSITVTSDNDSVVSVGDDSFTAVNPGYARVRITSADGLVNREVRIYVGGGYTKGDVNADGSINSYDALMILRGTVGLTELNSGERSAADINGDGAINSVDALIALQISAQITSIWNYI